MKQLQYKKYKVIIDGALANWCGYVYAKCQEDAFDMACEVACGLGGDFLDVEMCFECEDGE